LPELKNTGTLYYNSGNVTSITFKFSVVGVSLDNQLSSCNVNISKGTKSKDVDCATALKEKDAYSLDIEDMFSAVDVTTAKEGNYHFTFTIKWYDSVSDGDADYYEDDYEEESYALITSTQDATVVIDDTSPAQPKIATDTQGSNPESGDSALILTWVKVTKGVDGQDEPASPHYDVCADSVAGQSDFAKCEHKAQDVTGTTSGSNVSYKITGLTNGTLYYVKVRGRDLAGNVGLFSSPEVAGTPQPVADYWQYYKANGGKDEGGFCFIATEVFGSYDAPQVIVLRDLRDRVILKLPFGAAFVRYYYSHGRDWAKALGGNAFARAAVKAGLYPVVGAALALFAYKSVIAYGLCAAAIFALFFVWRRVSGRRKAAKASLIALAAVCAFAALSASSGSARAESDRYGSFSASAGNMWLTSLDDGLDKKAADEIFGSASHFTFAFSYEQFLWDNAYVGAFALGGTFSYYWLNGNGIFMAGENKGKKSSVDETKLSVIPLRLDASWRFEQFNKLWEIPLVPYIKGGVNYYIWWVKNSFGDVASYKDAADSKAAKYKGYGGTFGFEGAAGLLLSLNFIDPAVSTNMDAEYGVNETYVFGEFTYSVVNDFYSSSSMDFSGYHFLVGLAFDF